jgi:hypothetical protein
LSVEGFILGISTEQPELLDIIGIPARTEHSTNKQLKLYMFNDGERDPTDIGFPQYETLFLYSDVCEYQAIGDSVGPLLKLVPVSVKELERQCNEYDTPQYIRVKSRDLRKLEIRLCDTTGAEIEFQGDRTFTIVQLHFRKVAASHPGWC